MRLTIVGAGALGMLWAGRLQAAGAQVTLLARTEEQAKAIREHGVAIEGTGCMQSAHVRVSAETLAPGRKDAQALHADWVLLTVKQHHLSEELLQQVKSRCGDQARWICFQNGIGHLERAAKAIGEAQLYAAVTTEAALRESGCKVIHTGRGTTEWGRIDACRANEEEKKLSALWRKAGFENDVSNDIDTAIWNKLLVNACINPLTAILRIRNGELLQLTHAFATMRELFEEACLLIRTLQKPLDCEQAWDKLIRVCQATADNRSSMLQDIRRGRATEIDAITGALLREARGANLDLPTHRTLYRMVKALESKDAHRSHG